MQLLLRAKRAQPLGPSSDDGLLPLLLLGDSPPRGIRPIDEGWRMKGEMGSIVKQSRHSLGLQVNASCDRASILCCHTTSVLLADVAM